MDASSETGLCRRLRPDIAWSPDGGVIRFTMKDRIWEILSNGSNLQQLIPEWHPSSARCCGRWAADGKILPVSVGKGRSGLSISAAGCFGGRQPSRFNLNQGPIRWGGAPPASPHPTQFSGGPIPGRDGSKIFAEDVTPRGELSRFDPKSKTVPALPRGHFRTRRLSSPKTANR